MSEYAFEGVTRSSNTITWSFETQSYGADVAFPFSAPISQMYQSTIVAAFARWASVAGLTFVQVADAPSAAIRIGFGNFGYSATVGQTIIRSTNGFLNNDTVLRLLDPVIVPLVQDTVGAYEYSPYGVTLMQVAMHEIGHALGLDHSTDPFTVMYPFTSTENQNLATGDIEGINTLYPLYTVAALNPIQIEGDTGVREFDFSVTRYSDPAAALTIDYSVTGVASPGLAGTVAASPSEFVGGVLPSGTATFAAGSTTTTIAIDVLGNTVPSADQGFALSLASVNSATTAVTRGQVNAVVLDDDGIAATASGSLPIFRFFETQNGTHFFTASQVERNTLMTTRPELAYEGVELHAIGNPSNDPASIGVFRFFDSAFGTHFYTSNASERDAVISSRSDLTYEGVAFYEDATATTATAPVYRYFDTANGTHFFTASASERTTIAATRPDLVSEGVAFYAPLT